MDEQYRELERVYRATGTVSDFINLWKYAIRIDALTPDLISDFTTAELLTMPIELRVYAMMNHHSNVARRRMLSNIRPIAENDAQLMESICDALIQKLEKVNSRQVDPTDPQPLIRSDAANSRGGNTFIHREPGEWVEQGFTGFWFVHIAQGRYRGHQTSTVRKNCLKLAIHDWVISPFNVEPALVQLVSNWALYTPEEEAEAKELAEKITRYLEPFWDQITIRTTGVRLVVMEREIRVGGMGCRIWQDGHSLDNISVETVYIGTTTPIKNVHLELLRQIWWKLQNLTITGGQIVFVKRDETLFSEPRTA